MFKLLNRISDLGGVNTADQVVENVIKYINQEIKIMF